MWIWLSYFSKRFKVWATVLKKETYYGLKLHTLVALDGYTIDMELSA